MFIQQQRNDTRNCNFAKETPNREANRQNALLNRHKEHNSTQKQFPGEWDRPKAENQILLKLHSCAFSLQNLYFEKSIYIKV